MNYFKLFLCFVYVVTFSCKAYDDIVVEEKNNDSFIINEALPSYYSKQYISDKCDIIKSSLVEVDGNKDSFVFITDTHFERNECHSGQLINTIIQNTPVNKVIHGGDVGSEVTRDYRAVGFSLLSDNIQKMSENLVDKIKPASFYSLRGNHDLNCKIDENTFDGYPISYVGDMYLSYMTEVVCDKTDEDGFYYYFDNIEAKIRYIAIDTSYGSIIGSANLGYRQLSWIIENAIKTIPDGYSMVFLTHIPISTGVDTTGECARFKVLKEILSAINNNRKSSVFYDGHELSYDFTSNNNRVLFVLSGHIHSDAQAFDDNVLYITTTCDRISNDMMSQYEEDSKQYRVAGDITEQAFDVVTFSKDEWVMAIRIGAGYCRYYNRKQITLKKGNSISLKERLSFVTPIKWDGNDAPGPIGDYRIKGWKRNLTVLSIREEQLTAQKEGEAIVFAEDKEHNKEFFFVKVI